MKVENIIKKFVAEQASLNEVINYLHGLRDNLQGVTMSEEHNPLLEIEDILNSLKE